MTVQITLFITDRFTVQITVHTTDNTIYFTEQQITLFIVQIALLIFIYLFYLLYR